MTTHNTTQQKNITINTILEDPLFQDYCLIKNLTTNSRKAYATALRAYIISENSTLEHLVNEADQEEEQNIRPKKKTVNKRLTHFKLYLQEQRYSNRTINGYIKKVRTFYSYYDIVTMDIPKNRERIKSYEEQVTKKHITKALQQCTSNQMKAIILFMASSGTSRNETSNITIQDFIEATREYHQHDSIEQVIFALEDRKDIVPTFAIRREKTDIPYHTFCTPEATSQILIYLKGRLMQKGISSDERLFGVMPRTLSAKFTRLNDDCGFGYVGSHRFFSSHSLRRFFATTMLSEGVSELTVDFLEGRSVKSTHRAYYNLSPEQLKKRYVNAMNCVTILGEITYDDIVSEEKQELLRYRKKERLIDEKIRNMERLLLEYTGMSEL